MQVGTDLDGRNIEYDEASNTFTIGGISATIDRLIAYDRGGQVNWASSEIQDWAYRFEAIRVEHVGQQQTAQAAAAAEQAARAAEVARKVRLTAQGYDANATLAVAGQMRGLAALVILGFGFGGATLGLVPALLLGEPLALLVLPLIFGAAGLLLGYLATLALRALAHGLSALVQIEMNTRRDS